MDTVDIDPDPDPRVNNRQTERGMACALFTQAVSLCTL